MSKSKVIGDNLKVEFIDRDAWGEKMETPIAEVVTRVNERGIRLKPGEAARLVRALSDWLAQQNVAIPDSVQVEEVRYRGGFAYFDQATGKVISGEM